MVNTNRGKKKNIIILVIIIAIILLLPIPLHYKDGGSVEYKAILYSVMNHKTIMSGDGEYRVGITVKILGLEVFDNTRIEKIYY